MAKVEKMNKKTTAKNMSLDEKLVAKRSAHARALVNDFRL